MKRKTQRERQLEAERDVAIMRADGAERHQRETFAKELALRSDLAQMLRERDDLIATVKAQAVLLGRDGLRTVTLR